MIRKYLIKFWVWFRCIKIVQFEDTGKYAIQKGWFFYKYHDGTNYMEWDDYNRDRTKMFNNLQGVSKFYYSKVKNIRNTRTVYVEAVKK